MASYISVCATGSPGSLARRIQENPSIALDLLRMYRRVVSDFLDTGDIPRFEKDAKAVMELHDGEPMSHFDQMTPAPWESDGIRLWGHAESGEQPLVGEMPLADLAGVRDLRNALDVQMRRGWWCALLSDRKTWVVRSFDGPVRNGQFAGDNPITPLLKANAWYRKNVDGKP